MLKYYQLNLFVKNSYIYKLTFQEKTEAFCCFSVLSNIFINIKTSYSGDHFSIAHCRTKLPAMFRGIFEVYSGISKLLSVSCTISRGTSKDVLETPA